MILGSWCSILIFFLGASIIMSYFSLLLNAMIKMDKDNYQTITFANCAIDDYNYIDINGVNFLPFYELTFN